MRAETVEVKSAIGRILCSTILRAGGKRLLSKGHVIDDDDVRLLEAEGLVTITVSGLDEGEIGEDEAIAAVTAEIGCGSYEIQSAGPGRVNLVATERCCLIVDGELLKQINWTSSVVTATRPNFSYAAEGQRIASVRIAPFAAAQEQVNAITATLRECGPILQARPIRSPKVAVLYTDASDGERALQLYEGFVRQRLETYGVEAATCMSCKESENSAAESLLSLLRLAPDVILIASTTNPAGPDDVIGRAMVRVGANVEKFLAPVEPGNLFLMSYRDSVPIVSVPGCFRSAKANVMDLILPPLLARYRVSGWEIAGLGQGGLLA